MPTDVIMPQMGESIFEGTITKWLKKPGEHVQRDEPLFEISTDKVDAEIPSPVSGVLKEVRASEGDTVQVNTVVGVIDADGEGAASAQKPAAQSAGSKPVPAAASSAPAAASGPASASKPKAGSGGKNVEVVMPQMGESIFEGTVTKWLKKQGDAVRKDEPLFEISTDKVDAEIPASASGVLNEIRVAEGETAQVNAVVALIGIEAGARETGAPKAAAPAAAPVALQASASETRIAKPPVAETDGESERVRSSPLVRKLAREHEVDLRQVPATGMGGRITKEDIERFIAEQKAGGTARPVAPKRPAPAQPSPMPGELVPMTPMRKKIAERMVESKHTSAHVHAVFEVDMTRVAKLREREKENFEKRTGTKLTFTAFFVRAAVDALRQYPILNASVEGEGIRYHQHVNAGIAVSLDWGLIVPVIKKAEEMDFAGLQRAILDLADRARSKKLTPDDVQGGTFTVTNPGSYGQMFGLPIILQPQLAILGIGSIRKQPVVVTADDGSDSIAIRSICHLALGYDHRVIDGAVADQFLRVLRIQLEEWNEPLI